MFILPVALGLFYVKHIVENLEEDLSALEKSISTDADEVHVLRAEWAYLSRPERVQKLAGTYLDLEPASGSQIADVKAIPFPQEEVAVLSSWSSVK
jgi:cell division protein FtsL